MRTGYKFPPTPSDVKRAAINVCMGCGRWIRVPVVCRGLVRYDQECHRVFKPFVGFFVAGRPPNYAFCLSVCGLA